MVGRGTLSPAKLFGIGAHRVIVASRMTASACDCIQHPFRTLCSVSWLGALFSSQFISLSISNIESGAVKERGDGIALRIEFPDSRKSGQTFSDLLLAISLVDQDNTFETAVGRHLIISFSDRTIVALRLRQAH